jgi:hypothetical protein
MNNDDLLANIGKLLDQKIQSLQDDISLLKNGQAQNKTMLEAVLAGQKELQETVATKADVQDLNAKISKFQKQNEQRFENVEEVTGIHNPHKN